MLFLAFIVTFIHSAISQSLPTLPKRFTTIVEANIIDKEYTILLEEWFDGYANKSRRSFHFGNVIYNMYEDFSNESDIKLLWMHPTSDDSNVFNCRIESYSNNVEFFRPSDQSSNGHLVSSNDWFMFGDEYGETYMGKDFSIRGIAAEGWTRRVANSSFDYHRENYTRKVVFDFEYYFSKSNWSFSRVNESRIPLRATIRGNESRIYDNSNKVVNSTFVHNYEYISFFEGKYAFDDSVFDILTNDIPDWYSQCNTTDYCKYYPNSQICKDAKGPSMPTIPFQFQLKVEINESPRQITNSYSIYYDYIGNKAHAVFRSSPDYYDHALHELDLFDPTLLQSWSWMGDQDDTLQCTLTLIDPTNDDSTNLISQQNGHLADPYTLLLFNASRLGQETWMGYDTVRGIKAEKWYAPWNEWFEYTSPDGRTRGFNVSYNTYYWFSLPEWHVFTANQSVVPLRLKLEGPIDIYEYNETSGKFEYNMTITGEGTYEIFDYWRGLAEDWNFELPFEWRKHCDISTEYCEAFPNSEPCNLKKPLPELPESFRTTVEAKFLHNSWSYIINEAYDYNRNKAKLTILPFQSEFQQETGPTWHILEDGDMLWYWTSDGSNCSFFRARDRPNTDFSLFFNFGTEHVQKTVDWFYAVDDVSEIDAIYMGKQKCRGVMSERWDYDLSFSSPIGPSMTYSTNMTVSFYFEDSSWNYNLFKDYNIPVRSHVFGTAAITNATGTRSYDYNNFYDYYNFIPGEQPDVVFTPPMNMRCNMTGYCKDPSNDSNDWLYTQMCHKNAGPMWENLYVPCIEPVSIADWSGDYLIELDKTQIGCFYQMINNSRRVDPSDDNGNSKCGKKEVIPDYIIVLMVLLFLLGLLIGICGYMWKTRKGVALLPVRDTEDEELEME